MLTLTCRWDFPGGGVVKNPRGRWDLVPQPGIEPAPPAVEARSLNYWSAGEVLELAFFHVI